MSLDELKLPKENLFKFTCRDRYDSPNYTFTWELTPKGAAILQENEVRFPFMYVFAVEEIPPNKVEGHRDGCGCNSCDGYNRVVEEALFCLHEGAGQIQFHRSGEFRIYAMVIWYDGDSTPKWKHHRGHLFYRIENFRGPIIEEVGKLHSALQHVEEDAVKIGDSFFAGEPNPTLWWWANLWWDKAPANTCDYKKRLWFVLWLQVITVSLYALFRGLVMFVCYWLLLLVAMKPTAFSFRPMFHPFSSTFGQMCDFSDKSNYAFHDSKADKESRVLGIFFRMPFVLIGGPIGLYYLIKEIVHHPWIYLCILLGLITALAVSFALAYLVTTIRSRYTQIPIEKPKRRVPLRVRWLDAKGKLCLPFTK